MAWFGNWFSKRNSGAEGFTSDTVFFGQGHAAKHAAPRSRKTTGTGSASGSHADGKSSERKNIRLEQRDLLYAVVRETMTRLGLITNSYKYKVLSLDPQGRQYLIMIDLKQEVQSQFRLIAQIESLLTQEAKARHDITVTGIYWRFNENKMPLENEAPSPDTGSKTVAPPTHAKHAQVEATDPRKALEHAFSKPRQHQTSAPTAFQDTLVLDPEERELPLGGTQFGALK